MAKKNIHVKVPEEVWRDARIASFKRGTTLTQVIEAALRRFVRQTREKEKEEGGNDDGGKENKHTR